MKYPIFSMRDVKVGFMTPTIDANVPSAIRNFEHAVSASGSVMNTHPKDFQLYRVGEFDSETGEITPCMVEHIADAVDVV